MRQVLLNLFNQLSPIHFHHYFRLLNWFDWLIYILLFL